MNELISALAQVSAKLGIWEADKTNTDQNYGYISADAVLRRVGSELALAGLMIIPAISEEEVISVQYESYGKIKSRHDAMVAMEMTVTNGTDTLTQQWIGRGSDYTVPDKALYKAITSGHKYFLMKLFNIGVGNDDSEHDAAEEQGAVVTQQPSRPQRTPPPPKPPAASTQTTKSETTRPLPPEKLRDMLKKAALEPASKPGDYQKTASVLDRLVGEQRDIFLKWLYGTPSTKELTDGQHDAIRRWAGWYKDDDDVWQVNAFTQQEAAAAVRQAQKDAGQQEFPL